MSQWPCGCLRHVSFTNPPYGTLRRALAQATRRLEIRFGRAMLRALIDVGLGPCTQGRAEAVEILYAARGAVVAGEEIQIDPEHPCRAAGQIRNRQLDAGDVIDRAHAFGHRRRLTCSVAIATVMDDTDSPEHGRQGLTVVRLVVRCVIAGKPLLELAVRLGQSVAVDLQDVRIVHRELDEQA